jgi:catechol 2,3-dioxygenase-like lactoylglutathione lyase family enzyme
MFSNTMPNIYAANVEQAARFYRDLLGFSEVFRYPPEGLPEHVELRLGDSLLALSSHRAVAQVGLPEPVSPGHPFELVIWCDDVDEATARLRKADAAVVVEPYDHVAGHRRAYVQDRDGNWLALVGED